MESRGTTREKALEVNLTSGHYGTFAEIGAGQEVVRWFFQAGGAAGTISKSISAYDMQVSDAIYGDCERYVCRERLDAMLEKEQTLNRSRLSNERGNANAFFAFADTVSARNFNNTNECHGWMGIRFQDNPHDEDSYIVIHVRMLDVENSAQQEALGIVGVNTGDRVTPSSKTPCRYGSHVAKPKYTNSHWPLLFTLRPLSPECITIVVRALKSMFVPLSKNILPSKRSQLSVGPVGHQRKDPETDGQAADRQRGAHPGNPVAVQQKGAHAGDRQAFDGEDDGGGPDPADADEDRLVKLRPHPQDEVKPHRDLQRRRDAQRLA